MIKQGDYVVYKGIEYHAEQGLDNNEIKIYTHDKNKTDESFTQCNSSNERARYRKYVQLFELKDAYSVITFAVNKENKRMSVLKESEDQYLVTVGYSDMDLVEKYQLQEVDRGVFEGWISKAEVQLVEEKQHVQY